MVTDDRIRLLITGEATTRSAGVDPAFAPRAVTTAFGHWPGRRAAMERRSAPSS
jgi:hypothetical protein